MTLDVRLGVLASGKGSNLRNLADLGYPRRDDTGQRFDPARHEAVGSVPAGDVPPGTIAAVLRPGYGTDEHLLRPAQVIVARDD